MSTRTLDRPSLDESTIEGLEERLKPRPLRVTVEPLTGGE